MRLNLFCLMLFLMIVTVACGGGGGNGPTVPVDETGTITGNVYAPNGTDPISGALIYVVDRNPGADGPAPEEESIDYFYTEPDGSLILEEIPTGEQTFKIIKGAFYKEFTYVVQKGSNVLPASLTTLPATSSGNETVDKMAVVTGLYDSIENVLAKLGLGDVDSMGILQSGTEEFTLVDGDDTLDNVTYANFLDFFADPANYQDYRTIFINCGNIYESEFFSDAQMMTDLKNWVNAGGRLYITDQSYDFVEQMFSEYVDFWGDDPGFSSTPETQNYAEYGDSMDNINATILDANLLAWLKVVGATNNDDTVLIEGWLPAWVAIDNISSPVKGWVEGPVLVDSVESTRVITLTFEYGEGTVFFSSYHTEDFFSSELTPQDRILQYFIFEVL